MSAAAAYQLLGHRVRRMAEPRLLAEREAQRWAGPLAGGAPLPAHRDRHVSDVRIHTGPASARSARALGAPAYTGAAVAPVIGANLSVVADPARERELLRMQQERERSSRDVDVPTQFRLLEF